jgi:opacity protein-like surface antigen
MKQLLGLTLGALLLLATPAMAQAAHYCDTVQPTSGNGVAGQVLTISQCSDNKDTNGNATTLTGGWLYDNGSKTAITLTPGTVSTVSGKQVYTSTYTVPASAGLRTLQTSFQNASGESAKGNSFALTVVLPPSVATAPSSLTVK